MPLGSRAEQVGQGRQARLGSSAGQGGDKGSMLGTSAMSARRVRIRTALLPCRLGALTYITVRGVSRSFPDPAGAPLHWRQNADLSGLNILTMGIFYEALQRWGLPRACLPRASCSP